MAKTARPFVTTLFVAAPGSAADPFITRNAQVPSPNSHLPTPISQLPSPAPLAALSIRQPWAWLIAHGYKDIKNRTWHNHFSHVYVFVDHHAKPPWFEAWAYRPDGTYECIGQGIRIL